MKSIYIFNFFVFLIYVNCNDCDSTHCITDGFVCQNQVESTCDTKCKPKYGDTSKCYDCGTISHFYTIDADGHCTAQDSCSNGFIESSKECISNESTNINNLFHIDNNYYKECPHYTIKISSNECKCAYKYYKESDSYKCLSPTENCPTTYSYYDYETGECNHNCIITENQNYEKDEIGIKRCYSSCIGDEFYYGDSSPLKCTDYCDKLIYFDTINRKRCLSECPSNYKIKNNYCVPLSQCQFYADGNNNCLNSCEELIDKPFHNFQSQECIPNCNTGSYLYLKNNICYPEEKCNYIQDTSPNKKCLSTCNVGEGFIVPVSETPKKCYTSCPQTQISGKTYRYYNNGENECMEKCSVTGNNKIYRKNGGFECFSSCKDIDDGTLIFAIKNENDGDYICYPSIESIPSPSVCNYYIRINKGIKKCVTEAECKLSYQYLKGKECVEECDDYKAIDNASTPTSQLTKCFEELSNCFNEYTFYNINEKKCWNQLPLDYCKKPNIDVSNVKFEVIPISDNYYYEDRTTKYCVNSCQAHNKYIDFTDKKKCIDKCSKSSGENIKYYYYDPRNNECLETCVGSGLEFAKQASNDHEPCLITCPSAEPYIDSNNNCKALADCSYISEIGNKCLTSCDIGEGFIINEEPSNKKCYKFCPNNAQYHALNTNICIENCGVSNDNKYYINGETVCYSSSCGNIPAGPNGKYLYETKIGEDLNVYYICSDIIPPNCNCYKIVDDIKKCKTNCDDCQFIRGKLCLDSCDGYKANYQETTPTTFGQKCLTDLDECFSNGYIYYNTQLKQCWNEGGKPSNFFIKSINFGKYEIVLTCPDLEYQKTTDEKYCYSFEQCKSLDKLKDGNNKCVDECVSVSGISKFIYNSECLPSCGAGQGQDLYYAKIDNGVYKCYENQDECIKAGYSYLNEKECLASCLNFKVEPVKDSNGIIINLGKCFQNTDKCKEKGYYFYNQALKECWYDTCKNGLKILQLGADRHPEEITISGGGKETCVQECTGIYKESESGKFCLKTDNCPDFYDEDLEKCVSDCGDKYLFSGTKTCKSECNSYYYINISGKKECLAEGKKCKDIHKYYFPGTPSKCIDECYITLDSGLKKYLFYDPADNKCVESCLYVSGKNFADEPITTHQECKNDNCENKYYYDNENICRDTSCILFKASPAENNICVIECDPGQKVLENKCVTSCPNFFVEQKIEIKGEKRTIKKCINDCQEYSTEYKFVFQSSNGKECLKSCNEDLLKIGNYCYKNSCDKSQQKIYFNPSDQSCGEICTSIFYEKLSDNSDIFFCKSSCNVGQFKLEKENSKTECLSECPQEANYIVDGNKCSQIECNNKLIKANKGSYLIYECINNNLCSDDQFYSETNKKCYSICKGNDEGNSFSLTIENDAHQITNRKCFDGCSEPYIYYKEDKICLKDCNGLLVEQDTKKCVESCNDNQFKYDNKCWDNCPVIETDPDNPKFLRYVSPNNECMVHCPEDKKCHPSEGVFECISDCKEGEYKEEIQVQIGDSSVFIEYNCVSNYGTKYYYKSNRILRESCLGGDYVVKDTHECVENCNLANANNKIYLYYEYDTGDNDYTENTCILRCEEKKPFNKDGHCVRNCGNNLYYKESDKICLSNCPDKYYKNGNICVNSCKDINKFLNTDGNCIDSCPTGENDKKFYIEADHECIQDCTVENPFYTVENAGSGITKYKCHRDCNNYYIVNPNVIAKECLLSTQTCGELYSNEDNEKECYNICPSDKYFDNDNEHTTNKHKKCSSKCLEDRYHENGSMECKHPKDCSTKFADFDTNKCVPECNTKYYSEILDADNNVIYTVCLNKCNDIYGTFITPDNRCVKNCEDDFSQNSEVDDSGKYCKCHNLYYYDEEKKRTICLDNNENKKEYCYEDETYPNLIQIFGSKKCIKRCENILSLNDEFCYTSEDEACKSKFDTYSKLMKVEGGKKCDCPYKFYIDIDSTPNKKYCLPEFDTCTRTYSYYVPETRECVKSCADTTYFKYQFKIYCLRSCPIGANINSGNICNCPNYWYSSGNSFHCLGEHSLCPDSYPLYAPLTKECLEKCKGSYYPYLFDKNKCYAGCEEISSTMSPIDISNNDYAIKKCICERPWYYQKNEETPIYCPSLSENINYCSKYEKNIDFMIHDTKECVAKCPIDHLYYFNQECFTNCENDAEMEYHYVTKKGSYECQCKNLWHYSDSGRTKKECTTHENMCYKKIPGKDYLIFDTNECIDSCQDGKYIFNMTCYNKCPDYTVENEDTSTGYTCSCNKDIDAYWYEYKHFDKTFYVCGVKACPIGDGDGRHDRPYLVEAKKQCVKACKDDSDYPISFQYNLRKFCVNSCPTNTEEKEVEGYKYCEFKDLKDVDNKEDLIKYANVQSKELYERSGHLGGFLYDKFDDVSLQIYEINKDDTLKELCTKSNLTYIDFDTCLPKIYKENKLKDDDNIIVTKYDLKYWITKKDSLRYIDEPEAKTPESDNKFLINRVEYEFYNSRTMKKLDASVCDPYEILISYPLVFNKNKYDDYDSGFNNNEYKKKLEMGKKLHQRNNEYDTFNPNNTLYKEFCTGIELDGKDLVFEDRYNVLYPNGALLCETNCTYNSTDFEEERVKCKCTYKQEIDLDRVIEEKNDLVNDPNFHVPEQSSSNLEIVKCISKLRIKDAILNNEAFYYCASVAVVAVSMVFVTAFYGIKAVGSNISGILNKFIKKGNNDNIIDVNVFQKKNVNKYDNNLSTSNRILSNPPRKAGNNIKNEDDNINTGNIIENKDIAFNYQRNSTIENENDSKLDDNNNILNIDYNYKAEYLPLQYNFKYFKSSDKGVIKKIERSKLPFKVNQNTKYLLERKNGVTYHENYLNGPFLSSQNIIEIIDKENEEIIIKNNNNELYIDNDNKSPTKNNESQKKRNLANNKLNLNMNMSSYKKNQGTEEKEKDLINIKKIKLGKNDNNTADNDYEEEKDDKPDDNAGLYTLIKREQILLRVSYKKYLSKEHKNILSIFLAEILDKVYLVKICLFLKKYEIFGVHLTLYLFCHLLLLTLSCSFFTIGTIKKIWEQDNFPGIQFYLLYGLISNIAVWAIYKIFLCLLDMQDKIKELVELQNKNNDQINADENINEINNENVQSKFIEVMKNLKCKIIIFYCIIFVFIILFALYLISFFSIYTGTKSLVLETYIISIIEILLIKLVYGICLASLRIASEGNELICLYKLVYILDKYLS